MVKRKPPHWHPASKFNCYPSADQIFIPIINETKTRTIYIQMTTAEAITFAEDILKTCQRVVKIQEVRAGRK